MVNKKYRGSPLRNRKNPYQKRHSSSHCPLFQKPYAHKTISRDLDHYYQILALKLASSECHPHISPIRSQSPLNLPMHIGHLHQLLIRVIPEREDHLHKFVEIAFATRSN
jgi:hypothetical protein